MLVFSGADGSLARRITDAGGAGSDYFGQSLAVLPDINGNGFPDLAVGAIYDDTAQGSNAGSVVLVDPRTGSDDPEADRSGRGWRATLSARRWRAPAT